MPPSTSPRRCWIMAASSWPEESTKTERSGICWRPRFTIRGPTSGASPHSRRAGRTWATPLPACSRTGVSWSVRSGATRLRSTIRVTTKWTPAADKKNSSSNEETWTLLPDETILSVNCREHPGAQKYIIAADEWIEIDPTPSDLVEDSSIEIGPAVLLPDGRVFATGATGHTALYQMPPIGSQKGSWVSGPDFPPQPGHPTLGAKDAPACLLPNGKVLCIAGPIDGIGDHYLGPM